MIRAAYGPEIPVEYLCRLSKVGSAWTTNVRRAKRFVDIRGAAEDLKKLRGEGRVVPEIIEQHPKVS